LNYDSPCNLIKVGESEQESRFPGRSRARQHQTPTITLAHVPGPLFLSRSSPDKRGKTTECDKGASSRETSCQLCGDPQNSRDAAQFHLAQKLVSRVFAQETTKGVCFKSGKSAANPFWGSSLSTKTDDARKCARVLPFFRAMKCFD
jgi:hypothetical protein